MTKERRCDIIYENSENNFIKLKEARLKLETKENSRKTKKIEQKSMDLQDKNEIEKFNIILDIIFNNKHDLIDDNKGYKIVVENKLHDKFEIDSIGFMQNLKYNRSFKREEKLYVWLSKYDTVNVETINNIINIFIEK